MYINVTQRVSKDITETIVVSIPTMAVRRNAKALIRRRNEEYNAMFVLTGDPTKAYERMDVYTRMVCESVFEAHAAEYLHQRKLDAIGNDYVETADAQCEGMQFYPDENQWMPCPTHSEDYSAPCNSR